MEVKKSEKADISRFRTVFFLLGMCASLSFVYGVINYKKYEKEDTSMEEYVYSEDELEVEQTVQESEPPPPPEAPPIIEIVEDDKKIEEKQPEVEEIETDDDDKIDGPIELPEEDIEEDDAGILGFFAPVQEKAQFKEGQLAMYKFIQDNIVVPELALQEGQTGTVVVSFVVEKNGSLTQIQVDPNRRKVGFGCEEAAIAIVKKMDGKWSPALQRDKPVRMRFQLPIKFQLN